MFILHGYMIFHTNFFVTTEKNVSWKVAHFINIRKLNFDDIRYFKNKFIGGFSINNNCSDWKYLLST